jgi:hypothetical protein
MRVFWEMRDGKVPDNKAGHYIPGNCVVIPLWGNTYAAAWIAWAKEGEILGHIYAPLSGAEVEAQALARKEWPAPLLVCRFGDLGIVRSEWSLVEIDEAQRRHWTIPSRFSLVLEMPGEAWITTTEPSHPDRVISRIACSVDDALGLPSEGLLGTRAVEILVAMLITPMGERCRLPASGDSDASFTPQDFRNEPTKFRKSFYEPNDLEREMSCVRTSESGAEHLFPDWRLGALGVGEILSRIAT